MLFQKRDDAGRADAIRRLKRWVSAFAGAGEGDAIMVTELQCAEPGCPPVETVLAFLRPGQQPLRWKVHKPLLEVTEADVRDAVAGVHVHTGDG